MSTDTSNNNDMIEFDLNDLPELPEFVVWPAGSYNVEGVHFKKVDLTFSNEVIPAIEFKVKLDNINELKAANAVAPADGTTFSWNFPLAADTQEKTDQRLGALRRAVAPIAAAICSTSSVDIAAAIPGMKMLLTTTVYVKKGDKLAGEEDKMYSNLKSIVVL